MCANLDLGLTGEEPGGGLLLIGLSAGTWAFRAPRPTFGTWPVLEISQDTYTHTPTYTHNLEEEMATHSSILARIIPWREESGGL